LQVLKNGQIHQDCTIVSRDKILGCLGKAPELKKKLEKVRQSDDAVSQNYKNIIIDVLA
jgi:hypothetical protein